MLVIAFVECAALRAEDANGQSTFQVCSCPSTPVHDKQRFIPTSQLYCDLHVFVMWAPILY